VGSGLFQEGSNASEPNGAIFDFRSDAETTWIEAGNAQTRVARAAGVNAGTSALAFWCSAVGVIDGRSERESAFLWLRCGRHVGREAGEIINAEAAAPDFGAKLMDELLC
jgi:hypothetical protein